LKVVVETLIISLKPIGNILFICFILFVIFGILGVQVSDNTCSSKIGVVKTIYGRSYMISELGLQAYRRLLLKNGPTDMGE